MIPIPKKGPTSDPDKYRPIAFALSSCLLLGKLYAQLVLTYEQSTGQDQTNQVL